MEYTYTRTDINQPGLITEIQAVFTTLVNLRVLKEVAEPLVIRFSEALSAEDVLILNEIVDSHDKRIYQKSSNEVQIKNEIKKTGGNGQIQSFLLEATEQGDNEMTISFPIPINLISGMWKDTTDGEGDYASMIIAPKTVIGVLSQGYTLGETEIYVNDTVIANVKVGSNISLYDGVNDETLGRVIKVNKDSLHLDMELSATNNYNAGTAVRMCTMIVPKMHIMGTGKLIEVEGGNRYAYIPAGTVILVKYHNLTTETKKFYVILEYQY